MSKQANYIIILLICNFRLGETIIFLCTGPKIIDLLNNSYKETTPARFNHTPCLPAPTDTLGYACGPRPLPPVFAVICYAGVRSVRAKIIDLLNNSYK